MFLSVCLLAAVHALGNGSSLVYTEKGNLVNLYGPGYSSPAYGRIVAPAEESAKWRVEETRPEDTNEWRTRIVDGEGRVATMRDAIDPEHDVFVRTFETEFPIRFTVDNLPEVKRYRFPDAVALVAEVSTPYNARLLANPKENRLYVKVDGNARLTDDGFVLEPGRGRVVLAFCHPDADDRSLAFAARRADEVFARSAADWKAFFARGASVRAALPHDIPHRDEIMKSLIAVPALIRAQQARSGGVIAGRCYPMAYIRDQAGVLRGLLATGYVDEAEKIVRFWLDRFRLFGDLVTAEVMNGNEGRMVFNDDVEGPAYVIDSVFRLAKTRPGILKEAREMLDWAAHVQLRQLHRGMTCFSGDETYIAGRILPRAYEPHGSAESTARFILGCEEYLRVFGPDEKLVAAVAEARARFAENFVRDGVVMVNQPSRKEGLIPPRWQAGVCKRCWYDGHFNRLKSLEYDPVSGHYVCPDCWGRPIVNLPKDEIVSLPCVSLQTIFVDGGFVGEADYRRVAESFKLDAKGATGYDFAFRLAACRRAGLDWRDALDELLDARDEDGAWCEYYRDGVGCGCPCRPWESALNMEAVMNLAESSCAEGDDGRRTACGSDR